MAGYLRELKELLIRSRCTFHGEGRGDNEIWYSPISKRYFTVDRERDLVTPQMKR
jgi:hypothetical protein